jgi:putative nucleotidyltransferase with HDIG domain
MERADIARRIKELGDDLPRLPDAVTKLLQLMNDDDSSIDQIVAVIEPDPNLTTKILRSANSAYYGFARAIPSLQRAIPLLGLAMVRTMALSIGAMQGFPQKSTTPGFDRQQLWVHSLAVGGGMERLGKALGLEADYHFLLGFLHDVGQLVLDKYFSQDFARCLAIVRDREIALHEAEREVLGIDHAEVGLLLLHRWKFPEVLIQPVKLHHTALLPKGPDTVDIAMLRVANALAHEADAGLDHAPHDEGLLESDLKLLGITPAVMEELRALMASVREEAESLYAAMT